MPSAIFTPIPDEAPVTMNTRFARAVAAMSTRRTVQRKTSLRVGAKRLKRRARGDLSVQEQRNDQEGI